MQTSSRYPWGKGTPTWIREAVVDDSDKSFLVPTGKIWKVLNVTGFLTCSGGAGIRYLNGRITTAAGNILAVIQTGGVANAETAMLFWYAGLPYSTTARQRLDGGGLATATINDSLPSECVLPAGYIIRVWDAAAIAPAADDLIVVLHYIEYDA